MSETTSWDLAEFRKHSGRLGEVAAKVEAAAGKAKEAQDSNGQAFGILFGSIVAPLLNLVCGDTEEYARRGRQQQRGEHRPDRQILRAVGAGPRRFAGRSRLDARVGGISDGNPQ